MGRVSSTVLAAASRAERCAVNAVDPARKRMHSDGVSTQLLGSEGITYALRACNGFFRMIYESKSNMASYRESFVGVASRFVMNVLFCSILLYDFYATKYLFFLGSQQLLISSDKISIACGYTANFSLELNPCFT